MTVSGRKLLDGYGNTLQLRGVNISGFEFSPIKGSNGSGAVDPAIVLLTQTGTASPWAAIKSWGANAVRLPLNETSWNATGGSSATCVDNGTTYYPDKFGNYRSVVTQVVKDATAAGLYVVLDLQWAAPGNYCAMALNPLPSLDNAVTFWTSIANTFKGYPNVIFDLYNEPYGFPWSDWSNAANGNDPWKVWLNGGTLSQYVSSNGNPTVSYTAAGMQQMLTAVRDTGATNVVMVSAIQYAGDLAGWLSHKPTDPLQQMAASWHVYPYNTDGVNDALPVAPMWGAVQYTTHAPAILSAGIPIIMGEFGDQMTGMTPFLQLMLPWADANGVSYLGWTWNTWSGGSIYNPYLITNASGNPTNGFGTYVQSHYLCRAGGTATCQ